MPISVSTSEQQIAATVTGDNSVTATVQAGFGATGPQGPAATIAVGTVTTGAPGTSAAVVNAGTSGAAVLNFSIPAGATGAAGAAGPAGPAGSAGAAATVSVGTVTTGSPGSSASVTNVGSSSAAVLNFSIPAGATGSQGPAGAAATVSVGTVTTGSPGSSASVTNVGSSSAAVLNFSIPAGATGSQGPAGAKGDQGDPATLPSGTEGYVLTYVSGDWIAAEPTGGVVFVADYASLPSPPPAEAVYVTQDTGRAWLWTDPVAFVESSNSRTVTASGNAFASTAESVFGGASAYFDGTGDWLEISGAPSLGTSDFTVELWFRAEAAQAEEFATLYGGNASGAALLSIRRTGGSLAKIVFNAYGGGGYAEYAASITPDTWHHVAVSRAGTTRRVFLDGALIGTTTDTQNYSSPSNKVGSTATAGQDYTGYIDELRVITGSGAAIYTSAFTPPASQLTAVSGTQVLMHFDAGNAGGWNEVVPRSHRHTAADIRSGSATAGYVLTADGSGLATWQAAAGGVTSYNDLSDLPSLFSGSYNDLTDLPDLSGYLTSVSWGDVGSTPTTLSGYGITDAVSSSDSRLSDARTPTSHTHGNITNAGAIGTTSGLIVTTGASGALGTLAQGTAGQVLKVNGTATGVEWGSGAEEVVEYATTASFPGSGNTSILYVATDDSRIYRWTGSEYVEVGTTAHPGVSVGATASDVLSATGGVISAGDPGADRIVFWDDSAGKLTYMTAGSNITIAGTTISAAGSTSASDLTSGTLSNARLTARARAAINVFNWSSFR